MGFKDKAYELNLLVVPWLQIKLQLNYNYNMFKHSKQTRSKGMVPLFLMFKKNLNPSYWCLWGTKIVKKKNRMEKIMPPKV